MRIITGSAKGFKLKTPRGMDVRPTADRVKESIFNIIAARLPEASIADFFAGTGNLGLEALSRGAEVAVFVDNSAYSMNLLKENAVRARLAEKAEFLKSDVLSAIDRLVRDNRLFDVIFCDPPYNKGWVTAVLHRLDRVRLLRADGCIVLEHSRHEQIPDDLSNLQVDRSERYGETLVSFFTTEYE